ncbi:MAG: hypothetical protein ABJC39_04390 [Chloroflexota bacterium]
MTIGLPVRIVACLLLFLSSWGLVACGGAAGPSPSARATLTATATASLAATARATAKAAAASPPPGGPAPAQLIGTWTRVVSTANSGAVVTFTSNNFRVADSSGGANGSIVVNGNEIDFFNVKSCGLFLPSGVGRYEWGLQGTTLHFTPLNSDPCPVRDDHFANQDFTKSGG